MFLMSKGYRVIRVWNSEWNSNRAGVLDGIYFALFPNADAHPLPSLRDTLPPQGGGDSFEGEIDDIPFNDANFAPSPNDEHPPF
jgi:hypothetical protein